MPAKGTTHLILDTLGFTDRPKYLILSVVRADQAPKLISLLDEKAKLALEQLPNLAGAQVHSTVMLSEVDRKTFSKLGIGLTCDPVRKVDL